MNYLQATNSLLRACSEPEVGTLVGATGVTAKFAALINEAYREANSSRRWPWTRTTTLPTATANPSVFTFDPSVLEVITVAYNNQYLSDRYTYADMVQLFSGAAPTGNPTHFAVTDFSNFYVYPQPADAAPETLFTIYAYTTIADLAVDADVLTGPAQYHDAVVQLAYAIAKDKHFGDDTGHRLALARATAMLRNVFSKSRSNKAAPRIRV